MADEKTPEQLQQEMFQQAAAPPEPIPKPEDTPAPAPPAPAPQPTPPPAAAVPEPSEAAIPSWRLREEADARRAAEDRARQLEERLNQVAAHLQQSGKQPDFFEDPNRATQEAVLRTLGPYAEEVRRNFMYMGKMVASAVHGQEKVDKAEEAFLKAKDAETLDPVDYERVVQSPNRYD